MNENDVREVPGGADAGPPVMAWARFWQLVELLGGEPGTATCHGVAEGCARLTEALVDGSVEQVIGFGERLAEALYRLDREELGSLPVRSAGFPGGPSAQSDDGFLYARAAVVAAGREVYEGVSGAPERFAPFVGRHCEELLYVHEDAYERLTGEEWDLLTRYDYESCANRDGWPGLNG
ncbi:DUF4240 domain-containing protein [Kitasatospora sp. NPDC091207]|uniref:DUF4240 domain-containing protein n=1 Tax=Kitasatospora sp. NPDC091207 TaxID=3364083 RepID=UPI00382A0BF2